MKASKLYWLEWLFFIAPLKAADWVCCRLGRHHFIPIASKRYGQFDHPCRMCWACMLVQVSTLSGWINEQDLRTINND